MVTEPSPESEIVGLLRRAAGSLADLEMFPTYPGEEVVLRIAAHAVHRALIELEPFVPTS